MTVAEDIKRLLKEAQLYQGQGLLNEAGKRLEKAVQLVAGCASLPNQQVILESIQKKLQTLEETTHKVERKTPITEISARDKELIKKLFSTSAADDQDTMHMEGAVALAKFGQFDRAIADFEDLLKDSPLRIVAAKHIMRCHMAIRTLHEPMAQLRVWENTGYFAREELDALETFLAKTYGLFPGTEAAAAPVMRAASPPKPEPLPEPEPPPEASSEAPLPTDAFDPYEDDYVDVLGDFTSSGGSRTPSQADQKEEALDVPQSSKARKPATYEEMERDVIEEYVDYVSTVGIPLSSGKTTDFPVNLQTGRTLNLIVPGAQQEVLARMKKGARLEKLTLGSPIGTNTGDCVVASVARIESGPKRGDYSIDLKIEG